MVSSLPKMRNRFKPSLSNSRAGRRSTGSSPNVNAGGNVSSSSSAANNEGDNSSETVKAGAVDKTAQPKTPSTSSATTPGSSRRPRIKPAVTPVARARPNSGNKDKTKAEARHASAETKDTNVSVSQGRHTTSCNEDSEQHKQEGLASEDVLKSPSLKERNQQANTSTKCSSEKRPQPLAEEPVIKPSQAQTKNTNSDNVVTQTNESGTTPSLLRRKRVLPNLGLASRRRHSSVSKENVEKNPEVPEVRHEETVTTTRQDLVGHTSEQSSVECSMSGSKRLRTLSEEEKATDGGVTPATTSNTLNKEVEEEEEGNKTKGVKRKRGGRPRKLKEPSDPSQMTMQHLIYYNPKTNPMTSSIAGKKKKGARDKNKKDNDADSQSDVVGVQTDDTVDSPPSASGSPARPNPPQNNKEMSVDNDDTDGAAVAPRVKLDADGNIILDEESLLIPKSPEKTLEDSEIVYEDADEVNFSAYLKPRKVGRWSLEETQRFYKALSQVGTDFSLMLPLFPTRIRRELKAKFKREEKLHRSLVEKALRVRNPIDVELFTPKVDGEEIDDDVSSVGDKSST